MRNEPPETVFYVCKQNLMLILTLNQVHSCQEPTRNVDQDIQNSLSPLHLHLSHHQEAGQAIGLKGFLSLFVKISSIN